MTKITQPANPSADLLSVQTARQKIDHYLNDFFRQKIDEAHAIDPQYADLWRAVHTLFQAGGKRLRPYMLFLAYQTFNESSEPIDNILPAAAAQELLHLAMLIHDDIIDRDVVRYGVKNITGQYDETYATLLSDQSERRHFSNSAALLAGDLLISQAHYLLQQSTVDHSRIATSQHTMMQAIFHVVGGELLDTESAFRPFNDSKALTISQHKTASYSFVSPLTMGAQLAGANQTTITRLTAFGNALGIAYQVTDDILGAFGNEAITGKSSSNDFREAKHTFLVEQFYLLASKKQRDAFDQVYGNHTATNDDIEHARQLLIDSGARAAAEKMATAYAAEAYDALRTLSPTSPSHDAFEALVQLCIRRNK